MRKMNLILLFLILVLFKTAYVHADEMPNDDSSDYNSPCEKGWDQFGIHCYKLEPAKWTTLLSWTGASALCSELGAELASIHSKEENEFLTNTYAKKRGLYVWIGLHASGDLSTYQWNDGSPNDFQNWARIEPLHYGNDNIYCVVLTDDYLFGAPGKWVAWKCSNFLPLICKKKVSMKTTTPGNQEKIISSTYVHQNEMKTVDSTRFSATCERSWDIFGEHCYKLEGVTSGIPITWKGASARCSELGGHLASIHSKEENEFLENSYAIKNKQYLWIGLHASDDFYTYQWDDGSPKDYENWAKGDPLQGGKYGLHCAILPDDNFFGKHGEWIVWNCNHFNAFICKKKSSSNMSTTPDVTQERKSTISPISMKITTPVNQEENASSSNTISMKITTPVNQEENASSSNTSKHAFLAAVPYLSALFLILLVITIAHVSRKWMKHKLHQWPVYKKFRESKHSNDDRRPDVNNIE